MMPGTESVPAAQPSGERGDVASREWLVTNGIGGYASGTLAGGVSRRYHGLLIAALPAPLGRVVMLSQLAERVGRGKTGRDLGEFLVEVTHELGLPVWTYRGPDFALEKRVHMVSGQNTTHVSYRLLSEGTLPIELDASFHFRPHDSPVGPSPARDYEVAVLGREIEIRGSLTLPPLRLLLCGSPLNWHYHGGESRDVTYQVEASRGYEAHGSLWSPGSLLVELCAGETVTLVVSTERWSTIRALDPAVAREAEQTRRQHLLSRSGIPLEDRFGSALVLAADQFLIEPIGRAEDAIRAQAVGHRVRTVIAGYHWFTDWGRDTMISLEGLALCTGRHAEAGWILRLFARHVRDGLIPNLFPEGNNTGLYHTADATLWFFHAIHRYIQRTGDADFLPQLLPLLVDIAEHHERGTLFGIGVDSADGLLRQGAEGYQLTWMDAKVDGWVVTPRRGKAVEINALWFNAVSLLADWLGENDAAAAVGMRDRAERIKASFNQRFWNSEAGCLFDVVDQPTGGNDPACRPNQLLAISLPHPVLDSSRWENVLGVVERDLLTPYGLRSLSPGHPDFKPRYFGDLRTRDAAYHQGTVWAWLIGPFIDALLKTRPGSEAEARRLLGAFAAHLDDAGVGSISEIFDAEAPFTPRGCIAQAWSVAEVLRCWQGLPRPDKLTP